MYLLQHVFEVIQRHFLLPGNQPHRHGRAKGNQYKA